MRFTFALLALCVAVAVTQAKKGSNKKAEKSQMELEQELLDAENRLLELTKTELNWQESFQQALGLFKPKHKGDVGGDLRGCEQEDITDCTREADYVQKCGTYEPNRFVATYDCKKSKKGRAHGWIMNLFGKSKKIKGDKVTCLQRCCCPLATETSMGSAVETSGSSNSGSTSNSDSSSDSDPAPAGPPVPADGTPSESSPPKPAGSGPVAGGVPSGVIAEPAEVGSGECSTAVLQWSQDNGVCGGSLSLEGEFEHNFDFDMGSRGKGKDKSKKTRTYGWGLVRNMGEGWKEGVNADFDADHYLPGESKH